MFLIMQLKLVQVSYVVKQPVSYCPVCQMPFSALLLPGVGPNPYSCPSPLLSPCGSMQLWPWWSVLRQKQREQQAWTVTCIWTDLQVRALPWLWLTQAHSVRSRSEICSVLSRAITFSSKVCQLGSRPGWVLGLCVSTVL